MASGDTLAYFNALNGEPPASSPSTPARRNGVPVYNFDDTTDESIEFGALMSRNYNGGGVTVTVGWMAATATGGSETISLDVAFKSFTDDADDVDTKSFASANNANPTAASASGEIQYTTIAFTDGADMDSVAAGEYFRLQVSRDADGTTSTDDLVGDMQLVFVEIKET